MSIVLSRIESFLKKESSGGILLMFAAVAAIIVANSPLDKYYHLLLSTMVELHIGDFSIAKPLLLWINDGLMALFFFVVGLELKRELIEGELSDLSKAVLPIIGAIGGMLVPAAIYVFVNYENPLAMQGWAIPAATDIAFALGILALLGSKVPISLKIFLTSLAIFDDIGAILIIALFYTTHLSASALLIAATCIVLLLLFNRAGVMVKSPYIIVGIIMWAAVLKSGVHATLAGVILAMFIPLSDNNKDTSIVENSPLKELESSLHNLVAFFILPLFAFANAGLELKGLTLQKMLHGVPLGIAAGLFAGKQIGIFGFCWLAIKFKLSALPQGMNMTSLYAMSALCGVGFTMSLFIGSLAFEETGVDQIFDERLGIMLGSLASGLLGYCLLRFNLRKQKAF